MSMSNYGKVFKEFRVNRHFSLKQIANDQVSLSQLSKFERGLSDISLTKFLAALDAINVRMTEFMDRINNYKSIEQAKFMNQMSLYFYNKDLDGLKALIMSEEREAKNDLVTERHRLNSIMLRGALAKLDKRYQVSRQDLDFVSDYLFETENWGMDDVLLAINLATFYPTDLVCLRMRKILKNPSFYQELPKNQKLVQQALIDTLLICISRNVLEDVPELMSQLEKLLSDEKGENDAYRRIIFRYIKGLYQVVLGNERGKLIVEESIDMLTKLGYVTRAQYYQEFFKDTLVKWNHKEETILKSLISKMPPVPKLTQNDVAFLTEMTFGKECSPTRCDVLFVFSGTHPGHWETAIEAYQKGFSKKIIVTGGKSLTGTPHSDWQGESEAEVIVNHLLAAGIPKTAIVFEEKSTNTLENVLYAKEIFDFNAIKSVMFICKAHAAGRQLRTLMKHLPDHLDYVPYTFNATYGGCELSRQSWTETEAGCSRIWGEFLRVYHYGLKGDILPIDELEIRRFTKDKLHLR